MELKDLVLTLLLSCLSSLFFNKPNICKRAKQKRGPKKRDLCTIKKNKMIVKMAISKKMLDRQLLFIFFPQKKTAQKKTHTPRKVKKKRMFFFFTMRIPDKNKSFNHK